MLKVLCIWITVEEEEEEEFPRGRGGTAQEVGEARGNANKTQYNKNNKRKRASKGVDTDSEGEGEVKGETKKASQKKGKKKVEQQEKKKKKSQAKVEKEEKGDDEGDSDSEGGESDDAMQVDSFGEDDDEKRSKQGESEEREVVDDGVEEEDELAVKKISEINYKRIAKGAKALGVVTKIGELGLTVMIANQVVGDIPITQISEELNKRISKALQEEEEEKEEDVINLNNMFRLGQMVKCVVSSNKDKKGSKVEMSMNPREVNKGMKREELREGMIITVSVSSVEDHGYVVNTGIEGNTGFIKKNSTKKDMSDDDDSDDEEEKREYQVGQVIEAIITKVSEEDDDGGYGKSKKNKKSRTMNVGSIRGRTIELSDDHELKSRTMVVDTIPSVMAIQPLQLVEGIVVAVGEKGILVEFMGFYKCEIERQNLEIRNNNNNNNNEAVKIGDMVKFRIVYVMITPQEREIRGSTVGRVMELEEPRLVGNKKDNSSIEFDEWWPVRYGEIIASKIIKVDARKGIEMKRIDNGGVNRTIRERKVIAEARRVEKENINKYRVGEIVNSRVIGYSGLQNVLLVSMETKVMKSKIFSIRDIKVGEIVKGTIIKRDIHSQKSGGGAGGGGGGIMVKLSEYINGYIDKDQISDILGSSTSSGLASILESSKYQENAAIRVRVIGVDVGRKKVYLSSKKTILELKEKDVISEQEGVAVGKESVGVIKKIVTNNNGGVVVEFFNNIKGFIPRSMLTREEMEESIKIGKSISVEVVKNDKQLIVIPNKSKYRKYLGTNSSLELLQQQQQQQQNGSGSGNNNNEGMKLYRQGDIISGKDNEIKVMEVTSNGIMVAINEQVLARISTQHLSDHMDNINNRIKDGFKMNVEIKDRDLIILGERQSRQNNGILIYEASFKDALIYSVKNITKTNKDKNGYKEGSIVAGYVVKVTRNQVIVKFINKTFGTESGDVIGVTGGLNMVMDKYVADANEYYKVDQTVLAKIIKINHVNIDNENENENENGAQYSTNAIKMIINLNPNEIFTETNKKLVQDYEYIFVNQLLFEKFSANEKDDLEMIGRIDKVRILEKYSYGYKVEPIVNIQDGKNNNKYKTGFIPIEHVITLNEQEKGEKEGEIVEAIVLDTNSSSRIIDYSMQKRLIENRNTKINTNTNTNSINDNKKYEMVVELVKQDYLVLSIPSLSNKL
ncbi:Protein RRP5-like protein, partial [Zancudomyces culisetae]